MQEELKLKIETKFKMLRKARIGKTMKPMKSSDF